MMNFNASNEPLLLTATIATSVLFLIAVPLGIIVTYTLNERKRRRQAGGDDADDFVLNITRPFISKNALLFIWMRSAVAIVLGLCLLTVYAAKDSNLESSYDYYGPMHVRSYTIKTREFWQSSGLTRKWVIQGSAKLELEWPIGAENGSEEMEEDTACRSQTIYQPCIFGGLSCDTQPCSSELIDLESDRVSECVQHALESYNDNNSKLEPQQSITVDDPSSRTFVTSRDQQDLPILFFHGDTTTCSAGVFESKEQSGTKYLPYLGVISIFFGIGMLLVQAIVEAIHLVNRREADGDSDTECCSVASLDEEMGQKDARLKEGLEIDFTEETKRDDSSHGESFAPNVDEEASDS
jgi:hypothetical protein